MTKLLSERIPQVEGLQCVLCGKMYSLDEVMYVCPDCGQVGTLDVVIKTPAEWSHRAYPVRKQTPWEEERFMPIAMDMGDVTESVPVQVGNTPYYPAPDRNHPFYKIRPFSIKDDGRNPTASLKDRASAMVIHHALTIGAPIVATASTGNAAAALAGLCAASQRVQAIIFVPISAPQPKITQLLVYGAKVILIDGSYDDAFDICWKACEEFGWYNRSTGINPFTSEGKKTVSWEIAFSGYEMPDVVVVPVGDGSIINGVYKGFSDLKKLGWIERIPRLLGVQADGSDSLVYAWENNLDPREMKPRPTYTLADSISASLPRDRAKALRAIRETQGAFVRVPDSEILAAIPALARSTGVFAEPAAAIAYAGLQTALKSGYIEPEERTLLLITGHGLKDINSAMRPVVESRHDPVKPTLEAVRQAVIELKL